MSLKSSYEGFLSRQGNREMQKRERAELLQRRTNGYAHESSGKPWYCGIMIQKQPSQCATSSVMLKNLMHMMSPCFTSIST